jgi:uncharacterized protein (DUF3820 family)
MTGVDPMSVQTQVYISSGQKNGFYTLRVHRFAGEFSTDFYLRNLSTDPDKAEEKARDYFNRVYADRPDATFAGYADFDLTPWGQSLAPWERYALADIENGIWPFGKHKGTKIDSSPESYLVFWSNIKDASTRPAQALVEKCREICESRGLYDKIKAEREQREEQDRLNSAHIGKIGERVTLTVTIGKRITVETDFGGYRLYILRNATGQVILYKDYTGTSKLSEYKEGDTLTLKATIKAHSEYKGVKQTVINRPSNVVKA